MCLRGPFGLCKMFGMNFMQCLIKRFSKNLLKYKPETMYKIEIKYTKII